jgi:chromate transporter
VSAPARDRPAPAGSAEAARLRELAAVFLRLGLTAFGGPAVHIAMMEDEAVVRRRWLTRERFLDLLAIANVLPGPSSSEIAIYLGYVRAGWPRLLVGGACFIVPAVLLVTAIAWTYTRFGALPQMAGVLSSIRPVVVAILLQAVWRLGRTAVRDAISLVVGVAAAAMSLAGFPPLAVLAISGIAVAMARRMKAAGMGAAAALLPLSPAAAAVGGPVTLTNLFLIFLKIGAVVFGSGYVLLAFLRADLVERLRWLTEQQLLDAVAVGQMTPGPVFTTATFIGYLLAGWTGAAVATLGIFLPAFLLVAASGPFVSRLRESRLVASILDGVTIGSLALMAVVTWQLGRAAVVDVVTAALALGSAVLLLRFQLNATWLIVAGAGIGMMLGITPRAVNATARRTRTRKCSRPPYLNVLDDASCREHMVSQPSCHCRDHCNPSSSPICRRYILGRLRHWIGSHHLSNTDSRTRIRPVHTRESWARHSDARGTARHGEDRNGDEGRKIERAAPEQVAARVRSRIPWHVLPNRALLHGR